MEEPKTFNGIPIAVSESVCFSESPTDCTHPLLYEAHPGFVCATCKAYFDDVNTR